MTFTRITSVTFLICCQAVAAQTIEQSGCDFIEKFNEQNETSFVENFVFMSHNRELCDDGTNCWEAISKRTLPVSITLGQNLPSDPNLIEISVLNLGTLQVWLSEISNLEVELVSRNSQPKFGSGFIRVEIFDEENQDAILRQKTLQAKDYLENFLERDELKCIGFNGDWENGGFEYSEVWIKSDQSYEKISECLTEEVYNAFGVRSDPIGLASLYSDPRWLPEQSGTPNYTLLPIRDVWIMRLLYDELIENGDNHSVSTQKAERILARDCNNLE